MRRSSSTCPGSARSKRSGGCTARGTASIPPGRSPRTATGRRAEIKACCRLAALLDVPLVEAAQNIVPVAVTAGEAVEKLRAWAAGRCLSADRPGLYTRVSDVAAKPGRNVRRDPSSN